MKKQIKLSEEEENKILEMYRKNTMAEIEKEIGHSDNIIYRVLHEHGIDTSRVYFKNQYKDDVIRLHEEGLSYGEISSILEISNTSVYTILKNDNKISTFSQEKCDQKVKNYLKHIKKKYYFDETVFDKINTPDKAYCIGIFMADGCNKLADNCFSIELQERDVDILNKIKILMQSNHPLHYRVVKKGQNTYKLSISSKYLFRRLNEIGIVPRKSLILDYPDKIDDSLMPFLIKGYIDGDGWVRPDGIGFMSSDKFCYGIQNYLNKLDIKSSVYDMKRNYSEHTKTLYIHGRMNIYPLVEIMFSAGNLFMNRKHQKYIDYNYLKTDNSLVV